MMISCLIDPTVSSPKTGPVAFMRPQLPVPLRPAHPLDLEIMATLETADGPVGTWRLLNSVARAAGAANRAEGRSDRQQALARINPLLRSGMVRRIGRSVLALP